MLRIRTLRIRAVEVPLRRRLSTRVAVLESVPLLLLDLETDQGVTGQTYLVAYLADAVPLFVEALRLIERRVRGEILDPPRHFNVLRSSLTLLGKEGLMLMALSGFDMAGWDALAKEAGQPLWMFLGGRSDPVIAYNSDGLGLENPECLCEQLPGLVQRGFKAVKLRLGRPDFGDDLAAITAVKRDLPPEVEVMGDFNQCLDSDRAEHLADRLDAQQLLWVEEPVAYDDLSGCARVARAMRTPVQIGENFYGTRMMQFALDAGAADLVMPDVQRIGGVSGWVEAAALAQRYGKPMSSHLLPEISAHLLRATPTAHWLEYVSWAEPILREPLEIAGGVVVPARTPGTGMQWDERAVERYAVRS